MNLGLPNVTEFALAFGFIAVGLVFSVLAYFWARYTKNSIWPAFLALTGFVFITLSLIVE